MDLPIRCILWDMDGILIDTTAAHYESWRTILAGVTAAKRGGMRCLAVETSYPAGRGRLDSPSVI